MASAQKLPSGAWRTRATKIIDGKQVRKSFLVSSFNLKNQQSCGLKPQKRMVADFLLSFYRLFSLLFRL